MPTIRRLLIANRGEIACRIARTARAQGIEAVAVYTDVDRDALHVTVCDSAVYLGEEGHGSPYLDITKVVAAAQQAGADAVHPGFGFLSERDEFAQAVLAAGLTWVGPPPEVMAQLGRKDAAKVLARSLRVAVVPGLEPQGRLPVDGSGRRAALDELAAAAATLGMPLLIKAVAGGGGRGMRIVRDPMQLRDELDMAAAEAQASFGDGTLLVERYIEHGRHIEVQVLADSHGHVIHLGERECSIQRRHQKIVEEAPSPRVDPALRQRLGEAAVALARGVGYVNAGTVEFLLDDETGAFYFLEVNTRIQVEHPVTEAVTGLDLVALQLSIAAGQPLVLAQEDVRLCGHAIEVRICAEDPRQGFVPQAGPVHLWQPPSGQGVRVDHGLHSRDRVPLHYDAMVAKVIAHGADRGEAIGRLATALRQLRLCGVANNRLYLLEILGEPEFRAGRLDTRYIERHPPSAALPLPDAAMLLAAALWRHGAALQRRFRNNPWRADVTVLQAEGTGPVTVHLQPIGSDSHGGVRLAYAVDRDFDPLLFRLPLGDGRGGDAVHLLQVVDAAAGQDGSVAMLFEGRRRQFAVTAAADALWLQDEAGRELHLTEGTLLPEPRPATAAEGSLRAAVAGVVTQVHVQAGDAVSAGQPLVALEAMKMLTVVRATGDGAVRAVLAAVGDAVQAGAPLVELDIHGGTP